uniref:Uncharacterized protein n=1 Tax=Physcomitrium patens TaxID=3218 RepID=A0A2K1L7G0_PHYPA|nr:hypothetical protein PHYPA_000366 [Physcomitrium patens]
MSSTTTTTTRVHIEVEAWKHCRREGEGAATMVVTIGVTLRSVHVMKNVSFGHWE